MKNEIDIYFLHFLIITTTQQYIKKYKNSRHPEKITFQRLEICSNRMAKSAAFKLVQLHFTVTMRIESKKSSKHKMQGKNDFL